MNCLAWEQMCLTFLPPKYKGSGSELKRKTPDFFFEHNILTVWQWVLQMKDGGEGNIAPATLPLELPGDSRWQC